MTPARLRWGLSLILFGAVLLLQNMGRIYLPDVFDNPHQVMQFVAIIFIGIGLEKIFTSTKLEILSYLAVLATVGMVGYTISQGVPDFLDRASVSHRTNVVPNDPVIQSLDLKIQMAETQLSIRPTTSELFKAQKPSNWGYSDFSQSVSGDKLMVDLNADRKSHVQFDLDFDNTGSTEWEISMAEGKSTALSLDLDQVDAHLNLASIEISKLDIQANDCELYVKIGEMQTDCTVDFYGESNRLKLRLPSQSGVRIRGYDDDSYFEQIGLTRAGGAYINPAYETSANKIDIVLDESLNSLNIDFY